MSSETPIPRPENSHVGAALDAWVTAMEDGTERDIIRAEKALALARAQAKGAVTITAIQAEQEQAANRYHSQPETA